MRQCIRCEEFFQREGKHQRICEKCRKPAWNKKEKPMRESGYVKIIKKIDEERQKKEFEDMVEEMIE